NLHPIDSAFVGGSVPAGDTLTELVPSVFGSSPLLAIMLVVSAVLVLCVLRKIVDIIPCQLGAILRSKELINLENSAVLARARTFVSIVMMVPFLTVSAGYRLYDPDFLSGLSGNPYFFTVLGIFAGYVLLHEGIFLLFPPRALDGRVRKAVRKSAWTFFVSMTETAFLTAGVLSLFKIPFETLRTIIIITFSVLYVIYFIRKAQVLRQGCTIFQTFLYLCALEFLPTGLLVASAVVF
ncbi:MAG: DUF4271 domain-containing protein, partial [Bacteroidales bacterium]|nr:DUF4271 domain-containing protein [Bacteroidales bacterium]